MQKDWIILRTVFLNRYSSFLWDVPKRDSFYHTQVFLDQRMPISNVTIFTLPISSDGVVASAFWNYYLMTLMEPQYLSRLPNFGATIKFLTTTFENNCLNKILNGKWKGSLKTSRWTGVQPVFRHLSQCLMIYIQEQVVHLC